MNVKSVNSKDISFKGVRFSRRLQKALENGQIGYNQKRMLNVILRHIKENNYDRIANVDMKFAVNAKDYKNLFVLIKEKYPQKRPQFVAAFNFEPYLNASNAKIKRVFDNLFKTKTKGVDITEMEPIKPKFVPVKVISLFDKILDFFKK